MCRQKRDRESDLVAAQPKVFINGHAARDVPFLPRRLRRPLRAVLSASDYGYDVEDCLDKVCP